MPRFTGFGCLKRKNSPKCHVKNGVKNGKCHENFTLLGRNADKLAGKLLENISRIGSMGEDHQGIYSDNKLPPRQVAETDVPNSGWTLHTWNLHQTCEDIFRHRPPPDPTLESASPSPPQGRFGIEIGSNQEIDIESMLNRCQIDP